MNLFIDNDENQIKVKDQWEQTRSVQIIDDGKSIVTKTIWFNHHRWSNEKRFVNSSIVCIDDKRRKPPDESNVDVSEVHRDISILRGLEWRDWFFVLLLLFVLLFEHMVNRREDLFIFVWRRKKIIDETQHEKIRERKKTEKKKRWKNWKKKIYFRNGSANNERHWPHGVRYD